MEVLCLLVCKQRITKCICVLDDSGVYFRYILFELYMNTLYGAGRLLLIIIINNNNTLKQKICTECHLQ